MSKIFWSIILLAAYVVIMLTENDHLVASSAKNLCSICMSFFEDVQVYKK